MHTHARQHTQHISLFSLSLPQQPELLGAFHIVSNLGFYLYPLENDLLTLTESSAFTVCTHTYTHTHTHTYTHTPTHTHAYTHTTIHAP